MSGTSSGITFRIGEPLPPMPRGVPTPEPADKPFTGAVPTERFFLLFVHNVRRDRDKERLAQLGLNPASKDPDLFWRRYPAAREAEMLKTKFVADDLHLKTSFVSRIGPATPHAGRQAP